MRGKWTKDEVHYRHGTPEHHCGICEHYRHGKCLIVAGDIDPNDGCDKFKMGLPATIRAALKAGQ